jgi:hypothetical protein
MSVGTMGKGLALQFAKQFPSIVSPYKRACREGSLTTDCPQILEVATTPPRYVVNLNRSQGETRIGVG